MYQEKSGDQESAAEAYEKAGETEKAAELYGNIHMPERAVEVYQKAKENSPKLLQRISLKRKANKLRKTLERA